MSIRVGDCAHISYTLETPRLKQLPNTLSGKSLTKLPNCFYKYALIEKLTHLY